uniref:Uncharacterized protein n=1 Tax=Anguilla anguilla TaxID=7936 RepID=A0A0E9VJS8_ANGAN
MACSNKNGILLPQWALVSGSCVPDVTFCHWEYHSTCFSVCRRLDDRGASSIGLCSDSPDFYPNCCHFSAAVDRVMN